MTFLDDQKEFDQIFGLNPIILGVNPITGSSSDCLKKARLYADKCMLDVFIQICRDDYVGGDDAGSKGKLIHEICKSLTRLKQEYNVRGVGHKTDTPDELYSKYIGIVAGLPDDATIWSVNLCSTYYSALHNNLKDKMEESDFCMLPLNNMGTKALQIEGLRTVRTSAVTSYKDLNDEEKRIRRIFLQLQNRRQPRGDAHQYNGHQGGDQTHGDLYFSSYSQVEATLSKYGGVGYVWWYDRHTYP